MTPTEFYSNGVPVEDVGFATFPDDDLPALQQNQVVFGAVAASVATIAFTGMLTIATAALPSWASVPSARSTTVAQPITRTVLAAEPMNAFHQDKAIRLRRLFKSVPLNEVESLPDPDYGL